MTPEIGALNRELAQARSTARNLASANDRLVQALEEARTQLVTLRSQLDRLAQPPSSYGVVTDLHTDQTVDVLTGGRKLNVAVSTNVAREQLDTGREVVLNEALNIVAVRGYELSGEIALVKELLDEHRALVILRGDDERVVRLAGRLTQVKVRVGDALLLDVRTQIACELVPRSETSDLVLEEVPDIAYSDIGGLAGQIEAIRDSVELPYLHPDLYAEHSLRPPKGVLLYGPPGCGKTMIAKAVAASLARKVAEREGTPAARAYFLNIKGPELLNKYVGETERHIRTIFYRAREKSGEGRPVVVFFDEMDSLFRTRGSGISSDVETTIVPQLLAEIDGVEGLENVIVIGATNREDMIDPAILRPGRLDVKIKIDRPDAQAAREIFAKYLTTQVPLHEREVRAYGSAEAAVSALTEATVERMYATDMGNRFLEVTYVGGDKEILYFKDFSSGAMITNVVDRAKKLAIKDLLTKQERGITREHLLDSVAAEFQENEDLPNTTNPDDWARVSGRKGERVVYIRTLVGASESASSALA